VYGKRKRLGVERGVEEVDGEKKMRA